MRRKYIMAGAMLYLSLLAGTASANSSALVEETENSTEVWQVPHKPKGTKTRLKRKITRPHIFSNCQK